ncbi:hypothetical protein PRZ48_014752 [Zasmidium cellare]|uniref:Uncharacterized protein n=1 Tax=Zasmidium cellare TaxID=395010 RepID=A0ABR0DZ63_ZASCE|nr:hypothetical protein PRZ48_014752 [Zasmidium cellare]
MPLQAFRRIDYEASESELSQSLLCRRMLLQAGADPTITPDTDIERPILTALRGSVQRQAPLRYLSYSPNDAQMYLDIILRYANQYYIDWQQFATDGRSAWLEMCTEPYRSTTPLMLDRLLAAGLDVEEVDDRGRNCLFHCVLQAQCPSSSTELQVLIRLLALFRDVHAEDYKGMTIFDYVRDTAAPNGSYGRDLWRTALASAGYGYAEPDLRQAVYGDITDSTKYSSRPEGRKVLILGGTSGLGYAAAEAYVENGMTVVISSSSEERVSQAIRRILKEYPSAKERISGYACNLADQATLEDNIVALLDKVGKLDHIIYSAGDSLASVSKPLEEIDVDMAVKAHIVRYFAPMIGITLRPIPNWIVANGAMSALEGIAQQLALELAPIRVNVVVPGPIETELWEESKASMKASIEERMPTGRLAQSEDVAEAYLCTLKDLNLTGLQLRQIVEEI